jgi:hypothetical protein
MGIGGTIVLMILYILTRLPNPITNGRALTINAVDIATEIFQAGFIIITALILMKQRTVHPSQREQLT